MEKVNSYFSDSAASVLNYATNVITHGVDASKTVETVIDATKAVKGVVSQGVDNVSQIHKSVSELSTKITADLNSDLFSTESLILAFSAVAVGTFAFPPVSVSAGAIVVSLTFFNGWWENNAELKNTVEDLYKSLYKAFIFLDTDLFKQVVFESKHAEEKPAENKLTEEEVDRLIELINRVKQTDEIKKEMPDEVQEILLIMATLKHIYERAYFPMTLFPSNYQTSLTFSTQRLFNCFTTLYENSEDYKEIIKLLNKYDLFEDAHRKAFFDKYVELNKDLITSASKEMEDKLTRIVDPELDKVQKEIEDKARQGGKNKTKKLKAIKKRRKTKKPRKTKKNRRYKKLKTIQKRRKNKMY